MKITSAHFDQLKQHIEAVLAMHNPRGELVAAYERGEFARADKVQDIQKRFCFDVLFAAGINRWVCDELYPYLNDGHIYTALKSICPTVVRKF